MGIFLTIIAVLAYVGVQFGALYWAFKPMIDEQNQRIADSKFRNPKLYGHLPSKLFPWDSEPSTEDCVDKD